MASTSTAIEWTDKTWNPTTGCNKVSPGCKHCYAETITKRFHTNFPNGFKFTLHPERLSEPLRWRKPSRIFVNSMSGLFHEQMPISFLVQVFEVMRKADHHIFQILTKRHERLLELAPLLSWPDNVWMGVSVENQKYAHRVDLISKMPQQNNDAGELDEGEKVEGVELVANDGAPEIIEPAKEALDLPPTFVTTQLSSILSLGLFAVTSVWCNQLDTLSVEFGI